MGHPRSKWKHKKYKSRVYTGKYRKTEGEREFILICLLPSGKTHTIVFESNEAAKGLGWRKL